MRCFIIAIFLLFLTPELSASARAGSTPKLAQVQRGAQSLIIVEDEDAKAFRFIIDGTEVARIDQAGLKVIGDVSYGGMLSDTGPAWIEEQTQDAAEVAAGGGHAR